MGILDFYRSAFSREPQSDDVDMQRLAARDELLRAQETRLGRPLTLGERAEINRLSIDFDPSQAGVERTMRETREGLESLRRAPNTAAAGVARLPLAVAELGDLAVQGGQSLADRSGKPFLERFQEARHGAEGVQRMQEARAENMRRYRRDNPNATPEQIRQADDDYTKTEEYGAIERSTLGTVRGAIQDAGEAIDRTFGAPVDREKNTADRVIGGVAQSVVPTGWIARAGNLSPRADLALNLALPGARGGSAGNYTLNAAAGGGIPLAIAAATQAVSDKEEDTERAERTRAQATAELVHSAMDTTKDNSDLAWTSAALGVGLLAAIGLRRTQAVAQVARQAQPVPGGTGGQAGSAAQGLARAEENVGALFADSVRIDAALQRGGATRREAREIVELNQNAFNPTDNALRFMAEGRNQYLTQPVQTPFIKMVQLQNALVQRGDLADVEMAISARSALDSRVRQVSQVNDEIRDLQQKLAFESQELQKIQMLNQNVVKQDQVATQGLAQRVSTLSKQLTEANDRLAKLNADDPSLRMQFPNLSRADLQAASAKLNNDKLADQYATALRENFNAELTARVNAGLLSMERATEMRIANPNYVPIKHDTLKGATGLQRQAAKAAMQYTEGGKYAESAADSLGSRVATRNLDDIPMADRVTQNMPLMDQLYTRIQQTNFEIALNDLRRNHTKALVARGQATPVPMGPGKSNIVDPQSPLADSVLTNPKHVAYMEGGKIHVYRVETEELATAVRHMSDTWGAFSRINKALADQLRKGLTGELNPMFATANYAYDFSATKLRPWEKTFGTGNMVERYVHGPTGQILDKVIRSVGLDIVDPAIHVPAVINGIRLFFHAWGTRIAAKIESDLNANYGIINSLAATNPRVRAFFTSISHGLTNVLENSLVARYVNDVGQQTPLMNDVGKYMREVDTIALDARKFVGVRQSAPAQMLNGFIGTYRDALYAAHNAMRYTYYSQQVAAKMAKKGKALTDREMAAIATDARTITGDLRNRSEAKGIRMLNQNTLYLNVALQAQRTLYQRMTEDPRVGAMFMGGVVFPTIFGAMMLTSNKQLADWWYKEIPDWEKDSFNFFPNAQGLQKIISSIASGQGFPRNLTREDFSKFLVAPDFRFIRGATRVVLEYTGALPNRPDTIPRPDGWDITKSTLGQWVQNYVPGMPGIPALLAYQQGYKIQTNRATEGSAIQQFNANERMNHMSAYTKGFEELLGVTLGTFGRNVADALDTQNKMQRVGNSVVDSWLAAGQDFAERQTQPRSDVPLMSVMQDRVFARTPTREANNDFRKALELSTARRGPGQADKLRASGSPLNDPLLEGVRQAAEMFYQRDPSLRQLTEQRSSLTREREVVMGNKELTINDRRNRTNDINRRILAIEDQQNRMFADFEATIAQGPIGQQYQQTYQKPFTLKDWGERATRAYQNAEHGERQPRRSRRY